MRVEVTDGRIVLHGAPKSSPHFSSMPSARWAKKTMTWSYFASPVAAKRVEMTVFKLDSAFTHDEEFANLVDDFDRITQSQVWKQPAGVKAVEDMLESIGNPFFTKTVPWVHQVCADSFLFGKHGALLAMEMGTGKTLCAIQRILALGAMKTLVVAPKAVCEVWPEEWKDHTENERHEILVLDQAGSKKKAKCLHDTSIICTAHGRQLIVVVNYESFWREVLAKEILDIPWELVIYDEVHKLKSNMGKASRFAARLAPRIPYRLGLSGTPMPNNPLDGFGVWRALDPSLYGTVYGRYKNMYAKFGGYQNYQIVGWTNQERFKLIMSFATFRVDADVLNLPDATDTVRYLDLPKEAVDTYRKLNIDFVADVQTGVVTAANALARLMKLREVTCGFVIDDEREIASVHHEREHVLKEVLEEIDGEEVVIFCEFREDVRRIKRVCEEMDLRVGEVTADAKDTVGGKFPPDTDVLVCNSKSGGLGLNLVVARFAIFYSVGFSLSDHLQARKRVHRGGQYRTVTYIHLVASGTVDEEVYKALKAKKKVIDEIMNAIKGGQYGT